jgi:ABC-type glutathione transport system ATPase component
MSAPDRGNIMVGTPEAATQDEQAVPAAQSLDLRKSYGTGQAVVRALAGISVTFERGRFTAVMGPSGSGKSTLMHCMGRPGPAHVRAGVCRRPGHRDPR